jgi:serine/threonine-protein kinase
MAVTQPEPARFGRYQLVTQLAEGGMARLYLAFARGPAGFDKLVVVKQIRPELAWDQDFVKMFFDEARIAARLSHRNVVHTYEVAEENGAYMLAMEYLDGQTLGDVLRRVSRDRVPLNLHVWMLTQVLAGLQYAHDLRDYDGTPLGVVHRDVSPSNVFITYGGEVKLLDFGIAKAAGAISATHEGTIKGKLGYSAPEQFMHATVDARADIYAVGVMLWEALGQRRRRLADTPAATYQARIAGIEPKIREVCPDVPTVLAEICDKATAPDPDERYATAAEFQHDLEEYLDQASRPPGQREMAALLQQYFEQEQAQRRARIQELLSGSIQPSMTPPRGLSSQSAPRAVAELPGVDVQLESRPPTPAASRLRRPVVIGGAIVALGALGVFFLRSKDNAHANVANVAGDGRAAAETPSAAAAEPSAPRADDSAKKGEPATVQIFIQVRPSSATVMIDGVRLGSNPFQAEVKSEKKTHVLHASAPGYLPLEQMITYSSDTHLEIALRPAGGGRPARGHDEPRSMNDTPSRPAETASEPRKASEPEGEAKRPRSATPPPRGIDEKDPYAQ